jgi:hypothetical protein
MFFLFFLLFNAWMVFILEGIVDLHNHIMFYLIVIFISSLPFLGLLLWSFYLFFSFFFRWFFVFIRVYYIIFFSPYLDFLFGAFWANYWHFIVYREKPRSTFNGLLIRFGHWVEFALNFLTVGAAPFFFIFISFRRLLLLGFVGEEFLLATIPSTFLVHVPPSVLTPCSRRSFT